MLPKNIFRRIAPVGNPICLQTSTTLPALLDDPRVKLVQSGTAALAAAVGIAKIAQPTDGKPEVIIPAYCCPDVVAAIIHNDCVPVLVDFIADRPFMDLDEIGKAITPQTIAVIAVNFLGIPERCAQIRKVIAPHRILLIEDSAQWFPDQGDLCENYEGDLVILSFGKGKPVSLLGGGAVICRNNTLPWGQLAILPAAQNRPTWKLKLLFALYNIVIHPLCYWLLELAPFLEMGVTRYKALEKITAIEPAKRSFLQTNIERYRHRSAANCTTTNNWYRTLKNHVICLAHDTGCTSSLLRFPLLARSQQHRDAALTGLNASGAGATTLYERTVNHIDNIDAWTKTPGQYFPNADALARRLITLPTHIYSGTHRASIQTIFAATDNDPV